MTSKSRPGLGGRGSTKARPKAAYKGLIQKTRELIKGRTVWIRAPKLGVEIEADLSWDTENYPTIDSMSYKALPKAPSYFKLLLQRIEEDYDFPLQGEAEKAVLDSKEFHDMRKEIQAICDESDRLEKQDPDYDWVADILDPAEE